MTDTNINIFGITKKGKNKYKYIWIEKKGKTNTNIVGLEKKGEYKYKYSEWYSQIKIQIQIIVKHWTATNKDY